MIDTDKKQSLVKRIIVVEDNENVAKLISNALSKEGYETKVISYGSAAIFYALEKKDCLLLMEYQLPDMTAKEVITNLKNNNQSIPFIIMSPPRNEKAIIEMMKLGAKDYLVKEQGFMELLPASVGKVVQQLETEDRLAEAEKSLQVSEEKFRNIFNSITDAIFIYDFDGNILENNQAAISLLGFEFSENDKKEVDTPLLLKGKSRFFNSYLAFHPEDFVKNFALYLSELRREKYLVYETEYISSDDVRIPVECISRLIDYDNDAAILTIAHNISRRKASNLRIRQSEERLQKITNTMTDYIYTVYVDNGKPQRTVHSPACKAVTGYSPEEFAANPFLWIEMVAEQDREFVLKNVKQVLKGEEIKPYEHSIIKKNGKQAWLRNTPVLHFNDQNKLVSYDGVVQDITERKATEIELLEKQAHLNAIISGFNGLIYVCSSDYRIEFMNESFIQRTGYNPIGDLCYKALHDRDEICPWCVNEQVQKGEIVSWEMQSPKDNRWFSIVNTPIFHHDGRISKQSLIIDISDVKFAEFELNRLNNLYFSLSEEVNYPVCRFSPEGNIISANRAFIEQFSQQDSKPLPEQNIFKVLPPELSIWTKKNLSSFSESRLIIRKVVKEFKIADALFSNKLWVIAAVMDTDNNICEYQALLKDYIRADKEIENVSKSS